MNIDQLLESSKEFKKIYDMFPEWLNSRIYIKKFDKGQILHQKDEKLDYFGILCIGTIEIINELENGNVYLIERNEPIDFIGEVAIVSGYESSSVTIRTLETCYMVFMSADDCRKLFEENIDFYKMVTKKIAQKLYNNSYKSGIKFFYPTKYIIADYLANYYYNGSEDAVKITETREEISKEIGVNIKTLNRTIKALKEDGCLNIIKGKVVIDSDSIDKLEDYIEENRW